MAGNTREEILSSALDLFSKKNYHAVSMIEIADGANISKGTLYWYFDSKEDLFQEIAFNGMDYFYNQFQKIAEQEAGFEAKIHQLVKFVLKTLANHLTMIDVFRNNIELLNKDFKNDIEKMHNKNIEVVAEIIKEGVSEGLVKHDNTSEISMMVLSVLFTPQTKELLTSTEMVEAKIDFIYDFIMNGISREEH